MRRKSLFIDLIDAFAWHFLKKVEKDLDQKIKDQAEKERSRKLREGSIDVEFRVKD